LFLAVVMALTSFLNFSPWARKLKAAYASAETDAEGLPADLAKAIKLYEEFLQQKPNDPLLLNNLAWFLLKAGDPMLRDPKRALVLAQKAVALGKSAESLDTLAEACYVNGFQERAIDLEREALNLAMDHKEHYQRQLARFQTLPQAP
jgi:TPR repeat protein